MAGEVAQRWLTGCSSGDPNFNYKKLKGVSQQHVMRSGVFF